jgi:hypothetical protein
MAKKLALSKFIGVASSLPESWHLRLVFILVLKKFQQCGRNLRVDRLEHCPAHMLFTAWSRCTIVAILLISGDWEFYALFSHLDIMRLK